MYLLYKIILVVVICITKIASKTVSNLAFFGRGQRQPVNYWNKVIRKSNGAEVYYPIYKYDTADADNQPLVLYLPGMKEDEGYYTYINYHLDDDENINLTNYHLVKSEIKLVPPSANELITNGYTCASIGLTCNDLTEYDFNANVEEWLSKVDFRLYLESDDANNDDYDDESEKYLFHYRIVGEKAITNEWSEFVGSIDESELINPEFVYNNLVFRNYGKMPIYIYIGNTMFLKKYPTDMVREGEIQNNFANWSWHQNTANKTSTYYPHQICPDDKEEKQCVKFVAKENGDFAYYVHIENGISAPPEGISFRIRPMNDNQFKFKIDNKKEYNLTNDYVIHRNCKIPIGEESEYLIDVRSLVYSEPKTMLTNNISGFWLQTISDIKQIKQNIKEEQGDEAADAYEDVLYFYSFTLHHTYPSDTSGYVKSKLFEEGSECNINLETHADWERSPNEALPVIPWPDDFSYNLKFNKEEYCSFIIKNYKCKEYLNSSCSEEDNGYYLENGQLIKFKYGASTPCTLFHNPKPGYYVNKSKNSGEEYIKCTANEGCSYLEAPTEELTSCDSENEGKLALVNGEVQLCSRALIMNHPESKNYFGIKFENSVDAQERYIVHYADDVFNFNHTLTSYFVVQKNEDAIFFDTSYVAVDQCAKTNGLIIDRLTDFCSNDSSGMYYTCSNGSCLSEYQENGTIENVDNNECIITMDENFCGLNEQYCTKKDYGYYYYVDPEDSEKYKLYRINTSDEISENVNCYHYSLIEFGYYWNNYKYNDIIKCKTNTSCEKLDVPVKSDDYPCQNNAMKIVDSGFNLVFCDENEVLIPFHNITTIFIKGPIDSDIYNDSTKYYAFSKKDNGLVFDHSVYFDQISNHVVYNCMRGVCDKIEDISSTCNPLSEVDEEKSGCYGYYLIEDTHQLYECVHKNGDIQCNDANLIGYFKNNGVEIDDKAKPYVKCTLNGATINCTGLDAPINPYTLNNRRSVTQTCTIGELIYVNESTVGLCVDGDKNNSINIFANTEDKYFLPAYFINQNFSASDRRYYILKLDTTKAVPKSELEKTDYHYKYTFANYKILRETRDVCTGGTGSKSSDLIEYTRNNTGNTYTRQMIEN